MAADVDIAISGDNLVALYGSVSHSHSAVGKRNMLAGKKGCMCDEKELAVAGCKCEASGILDEHGNYCLVRLKESDLEWWHGLVGMEYEVLSFKIDVEEPDAAHIISIACNMMLETRM